MNDQAGKLSDLMKDRCAASHAKKKQMRMLANTEKLQFYLQAAFDHFTRDLNTPFDFVKEMLRHSPVSRNFEGNILNLALLIKDSPSHPALRKDAEQIFRAMGPMIASCVMLDAVRQKLPGWFNSISRAPFIDRSSPDTSQELSVVYWMTDTPNHVLERCRRLRSSTGLAVSTTHPTASLASVVMSSPGITPKATKISRAGLSVMATTNPTFTSQPFNLCGSTS